MRKIRQLKTEICECVHFGNIFTRLTLCLSPGQGRGTSRCEHYLLMAWKKGHESKQKNKQSLTVRVFIKWSKWSHDRLGEVLARKAGTNLTIILYWKHWLMGKQLMYNIMCSFISVVAVERDNPRTGCLLKEICAFEIFWKKYHQSMKALLIDHSRMIFWHWKGN